VRCLYAASEVAGFAKTGGLADVAGSLPRALAERGVDCAVIMPLYHAIRTSNTALENTGLTLSVPIGPRLVSGGIFRATLPHSTVPIFFIDQPAYFDRDDPSKGAGLYQHTTPDGAKRDYPDNCERFVFFSRAVLEAIRALDFWPDAVHCNDWQTGLVPVYLREVYQAASEPQRKRYLAVRSLLTIHNLAYQGVFWHLDMPLTALPWRLFNYEQLEFYGRLNFLKGGIVFADCITTVSPMYAREIQTPYFGCGLHNVLARRGRQLHGIVNGVDYQVWNPAADPHLAARYTMENVHEGKAACKNALQKHYRLPEKPHTPLLGMVSRLVDQKGLDLLAKGAHALLQHDVQLVVLGEGDPTYHAMMTELRGRFPARVGVTLAQDEKLAHQIEAAADIFLMPSQFEPCGLSQLYSLKYGTVPLVRATGGLADTVVDATAENLHAGTATGFAFLPYTPAAFLETVHRALCVYCEQPDRWLALQRTGMVQDWSWNRSAAEYERLYVSVCDKGASGSGN
jgi:starch synthase